MPQFAPGASKTAGIMMRNPTGKAFEYNGVIYLGMDLAVVSEKPFNLAPGEEKPVSFPVTMPATPGAYPLHVGVFSGGENIALYKGDDIQILLPAAEVLKGYIRTENPGVSEAFSGWTSYPYVAGGQELNLALFGARVQLGVLLRNPTDSPIRYTPVIYVRHWIEPNNYTNLYPAMGIVEPERFSPAPTGMPYSNYEYEADKLLISGGELGPGETGFAYTELYQQGRRWNYVYLHLESEGYDLGTHLMHWGWYSY